MQTRFWHVRNVSKLLGHLLVTSPWKCYKFFTHSEHVQHPSFMLAQVVSMVRYTSYHDSWIYSEVSHVLAQDRIRNKKESGRGKSGKVPCKRLHLWYLPSRGVAIFRTMCRRLGYRGIIFCCLNHPPNHCISGANHHHGGWQWFTAAWQWFPR